MKKSLIILLLLAAATSANAYTFFYNGVLMGTVCRSGVYFTSYPSSMAQPVGSFCPVRNSYGNIIGQGVVTDE